MVDLYPLYPRKISPFMAAVCLPLPASGFHHHISNGSMGWKKAPICAFFMVKTLPPVYTGIPIISILWLVWKTNRPSSSAISSVVHGSYSHAPKKNHLLVRYPHWYSIDILLMAYGVLWFSHLVMNDPQKKKHDIPIYGWWIPSSIPM